MRLKYYILALRQMNLKKSFVVILTIFIVILGLVLFITKRVEPVIETLCESKAKSIALNTTNDVVSEYIKTITYDTLIELKQNEDGKVVALTANVMEMNRLTNSISSDIQEKLSNLEASYIKIPLGSILNIGMFSGYGPNISIKVTPVGNVSAKFNSTFEQAGINQTKNIISLQVTAKVKIIAPFYIDSQEYVNEITVAETIIIGDTPTSYYNINGMNPEDAVGISNE